MSSTPIGRFRAHSTRDGEALFEIQFADGPWMLARLDDLVQVVPRASD